MNLFQKLLAGFSPKKPAPVPAPPPAANWLEIDGQLIDLAQLSQPQLADLEARLLARRQQQESALAHYLHTLATERERLLAARDPMLWLTTLKLMFGENIGRRVATQNIGPGMQIQHLVTAFGHPDHLETSGGGLLFVYGNQQTGSYFELEGDTIVRAVVITRPPLPAGFGAAELL